MARPVHLLGEGGRSACCGKSMSSLGLGAMLTDSEADVTCFAYSPPEGDEDYFVEQGTVTEGSEQALLEQAALFSRIAELEAEKAQLFAQIAYNLRPQGVQS